MLESPQTQQAQATTEAPAEQTGEGATSAGKPRFSLGDGPLPLVAAAGGGAAGAPSLPTASELAYGQVDASDAKAAEPPKAEAPEVAPNDPSTLEAILAKTGKTADAIKDQPYELGMVARELLKAKGITSPTNSQLEDTTYKLNEVIKSGNWQTFTAPYGDQVLKLEDGVNERLGNIFFEKKVFSPEELQTDNLKLNESEAERLRGGYESGATGMVLAASFINTRHRAEGDFSRAYGDDAWRGFVRAETFLQSIPKGQFLAQLDVELMMEVNRLIHASDLGFKAKLLRTIAMLGRGGRWDHGGELREGRQFARPDQYSAPEMENLREAAVTVNQLSHDADGGGKAMLEYPKPDEVRPGLERLVAELKADLAKPDADPIGAASKFQRHFVALHPFGDSNGRTSRILMNRILGEFDLPPAILADQNRDISQSPEEWRTEVAKGCARTKTFLSQRRIESKDNYLASKGIRAVEESPNKPITLGGSPFDLGTDGLLYDPTGRPWIVQDNEVIPLAQLEHFMLSRRIFQSGAEKGGAQLTAVTAATRALYDKVAADPAAGEGIVVRDDASARKADAAYKMSPEPEVAKTLAELTEVGGLDPATLFKISGARGTSVSSTISKHAQIDLEFWYIERGVRDKGQDELVEQVRAQRAKLFELAKAELAKTSDPARVSAENPMGFRYRYEKMMFDSSPLRFGSFGEAIDELGDKQITVWRGDYSFARVIGMAPNNDIRQPDAKAVAEQRADNNQLTNLYDDLVKLEGSAVGRQYICTTSDLALLTGQFADATKSQTVSLSSLPALLRDRVLGWIQGKDEVTVQAEERKQSLERGDSILPAEGGGGKEIKDTFGIPGTIITLKVVDRAAGKIEVSAPRKAFQIVLDKDALLPGIDALGGGFESEQEMHGLERVSPWSIKSAHKAETLREEFPIQQAQEAKPEQAEPEQAEPAVE